jgi:putative ABC transport system permease protein
MSVIRQRPPRRGTTVRQVLLTTLRDLQWRARRFLIAGAGAAVVFALTLVLAGLVSSFTSEASRVVDAVGADSWVVRDGVDGVFTTPSVVPASVAAQVAKEPGVRRADPIVVLHHTLHFRGVQDVNLVGYVDGGLGEPRLRSGRLPRTASEVVVDASAGAGLGQRVALAGRQLTVVGLTQGLTMNAGQPLVHLRLADAQDLLVSGARVATAVVTEGVPERLPDGYVVRSRERTRSDLLRPIRGALSSLQLTLALLWCVAALVIGSVVYLSALERGRDFAVYKATGWSTCSLAAGLALEAVLLSTSAALLGLVVAQALLPLFPLTFQVPMSARVLLPVVGGLVGLLASAAGLRRAVGVDPALAFGGQG